jgi:hypothetical protein
VRCKSREDWDDNKKYRDQGKQDAEDFSLIQIIPTLHNHLKLISIIASASSESLNQRFFSRPADSLEAPLPPHRLAARSKSFPVD